MPVFEITSPDGRKFRVNGPEGSTADQALEQVKAKLGTKEPAPAAPAEVTAGERTNAAVGGVNKGIAGLAGLPVDAVENIINLGIAAYGKATGTTPELLKGSFGGSQSIAGGLEKFGINTQNPRPDDAASRMLNTAGTIVGGSLVPGAGIRNTAAAAAGGALASEVLGPEYTGVGAMVPGAVAQAASAVKAAVANPKTVQKNIQTFKEAGTTPDVAQATDSTFFRGLTNVVARIPGGNGVITKFRELEQKALGDKAVTGVTAEAGGRAIKKGITGEGGFLERTKATWTQLDDELAKKAGGTAVMPAETLSALDSLTAPTAGAVKTTGALVNPKLAEMKANIQSDLQANNGTMPFEALRTLRSRVGEMLDDSLVTGINNGQLKKVYGALSKDLEGAAKQAGAGQEFARQSSYYKARMERIETTLDGVLGKGKTPEAIFKAVAPTDVDSVNKVRRVMRSLNPEERQTVSEAIVNRLGRASPGRQDLTGEKFSSDTFLTNWSRINDSAKAQLFPNPDIRKKLDAIADVSSNVREGKAVFANPSGTAQGITATSIYGSPLVSLATGNVAPMVIAGSVVAGANIGAKMLTSPKVVNWLAQTSKVRTSEQTLAQMGRLAVIFNETKDQQLKQELGDYLQSIGR